MYLLFGVLTTVVSIGVYALCTKLLNINYMISNIISWVISVLFAYITNRMFVFKSKSDDILIEIYQFYKYRIYSFRLEKYPDTG